VPNDVPGLASASHIALALIGVESLYRAKKSQIVNDAYKAILGCKSFIVHQNNCYAGL
jgi:hypothetical protein